MALTELVTRELVPLLKRGASVAALGYPDIIAPDAVIRELIGELKYSMLRFRPDSEKICKWHGLPMHRIPDSESFFELFGAKLDVFDIYPTRGGEFILDLNYPIPKNFALSGDGPLGYYDFVLDVGTIEHCFNIGQAALNAAGLLKKGGIIYHSNPFVSGNHGFYGLNPTWFADFYSQPGFELLWVKLKPTGPYEVMDVPLKQRFHIDSSEISIFAAARRTEILEIGYVMQSKYVALAAAGKPGVGATA